MVSLKGGSGQICGYGEDLFLLYALYGEMAEDSQMHCRMIPEKTPNPKPRINHGSKTTMNPSTQLLVFAPPRSTFTRKVWLTLAVEIDSGVSVW
jgi:hypothetical protein